MKKVVAILTLFAFIFSFGCGSVIKQTDTTTLKYGYQQRVDDKGKVVESKEIGLIGKEAKSKVEKRDRKFYETWWFWTILGLGLAGAGTGIGVGVWKATKGSAVDIDSQGVKVH